jgi:hypothetical protein
MHSSNKPNFIQRTLSYSKGLIRSQKISCYCPFKSLSNTNCLNQKPWFLFWDDKHQQWVIGDVVGKLPFIETEYFAKIYHIFLLNCEERVCKLIFFPLRQLKPFQAHIIC